ncbi:MAG: 6-pyruvoyl-tetrahydropterin synthase-related protein [Candidatus Woesebacteria bacterium]|jgi:uncharacterized membrane protein
MIKVKNLNIFYSLIIIFIISFILTSDLFFHQAQAQTFDEWTHLITIKQFYNAWKEGDFFPSWSDGVANYGFPLPLVAHQTTAYLGAFFHLFTSNVITSYNLVLLTGAFLSNLFLYQFLKLYFDKKAALIATILFNFNPYRIINIYIRGALPEFFATAFLPLTLIGLYQTFKQKKVLGIFISTLSITLLILSHPMVFLISSFLIIPYFFYLIWPIKISKEKIKLILVFFSILSFSLLISSYYLLPLLIEIKYFYYAAEASHFSNQFFSLANYFSPKWLYADKSNSGIRANFIKHGLFETLILIFSVFYLFLLKFKKKFNQKKLKLKFLIFWQIMALLLIFLTLPLSKFLYHNISFLDQLQYPWRILSALSFISPIILAFFLDKYQQKFLAISIVILILVMRIPQIYGKNYIKFPQSRYDFTEVNIHSTNMNTIWSGVTTDYPLKKEKAAIIEGEGSINILEVENANRKYQIKANSPVRMIDYTFYFPGWKLYVDGQETEIEFQDMNYRGVITYRISQGDHEVKLIYESTKVRLIARILSILALFVFPVLLLFEKRHHLFLK